MSEFDINEIMSLVLKDKKIFVSEADFQHEMGYQIRKKYNYKVILEYANKNLTAFGKMMHIDILVITNNDEWIPIELKYKTKSRDYEDEFGLLYTLKTHGAKDLTCYAFYRDVYRIEEVKKFNFKENNLEKYKFLKGYAIFLTNDMTYQKPARKINVSYKDFELADETNMNLNPMWNDNSKTFKNKEKITLNRNYFIKWNKASHDFKYLIIEV